MQTKLHSTLLYANTSAMPARSVYLESGPDGGYDAERKCPKNEQEQCNALREKLACVQKDVANKQVSLDTTLKTASSEAIRRAAEVTSTFKDTIAKHDKFPGMPVVRTNGPEKDAEPMGDDPTLEVDWSASADNLQKHNEEFINGPIAQPENVALLGKGFEPAEDGDVTSTFKDTIAKHDKFPDMPVVRTNEPEKNAEPMES